MKVSIITVTFNAESTIAKTLSSILAQTYSDIELVLVDGASTDRTLTAIAPYREQINRFCSEPDQGIYDAMNKAVAMASGDYLLFMNAGDVFVDPDALKKLVAVVDPSGGEQVVWGGWLVLSRDGQYYARVPNARRGLFNHQATLYSRTIHAWHGGYLRVKGLTAADFLFFRTLQATERVSFQTIDSPVAMIDPFGVSAGLQTYFQRLLVDMLCGYEGRYSGVAKVLIHPAYNKLKRILRPS
ncbi:MAG: glycosyltransferase [Rhodocyclaceae bacterium]|nr:glycosyltransferase [Rhodocyclaceae bacterium]